MTRLVPPLRLAPIAGRLALGLTLGLGALLLAAMPALAQPVIGSSTGIILSGPPERPAPAHRDTGMNSFMATQGAGGLDTLPVGPLPPQPVVVELFTAQGCSSCPPADAMLADMAERNDLLALSFHVDYWDYLGWIDTLARPEFTRRQQTYAHAFREHGLYTPQVIVGGTDTMIAPRPADLDALIEAHRTAPPALALTLEREGTRSILTLTPRRALSGRVEVGMVRYLPRRMVRIEAGENRGRHIEYRNIVLRMDRLADWDGRRVLRLSVSQGDKGLVPGTPTEALPEDTRHAIIVQEAGPGPILAAIRLD